MSMQYHRTHTLVKFGESDESDGDAAIDMADVE